MSAYPPAVYTLSDIRPHNNGFNSDARFVEVDDERLRLIAAAPDLAAACKRAIPWLGKLIADGAHLNSVAPNDAIGALEQLETAIAKAESR